jgi:asparagine synthetase B (glutamine-hydrolysing)
MLPRLANVLAMYLRSNAARAECEHALRATFPQVRLLESGWLVGERPLPGSPAARCVQPELTVWEGEGELLSSGLQSEPIDGLAERVRRLQGEVGFARLEPSGRFLITRSAGGLVPVYVARDAESVCIATSFEDLLRHRQTEPRADAMVQALWSEGNAAFPDQRTFFEGVQNIPRGHVAVGDLGVFALSTYWDPRPAHIDVPGPTLARAHAEEFRAALLAALTATLSPDEPNLLTLSGGVDSSALAFLAHGLGFPLSTLTFVAPRRSSARPLQLAYVDSLVTELSIEHARRFDAEDEALEQLFQRPLPALFYCPHPALRLLPEVAPELRPRVLFSGHFADEVSGYSQRLQDWITHTSARQLFDRHYPLPSGWRDVGRWLKRRTLQGLGYPLLPFPEAIGPWFAPELRIEVRDWAARERQLALCDPRPLRELAAWCRLDGWLAMQWECCSRWGIRPSTPFFTRRMLELAFRCHPVELFGPGTKKILRRGLHGLVPARYLERADKGHWKVIRLPPVARRMTGLPADVQKMLSGEYPFSGKPLTSLEDRALSQLVLFSRKVREVRHAAYG